MKITAAVILVFFVSSALAASDEAIKWRADYEEAWKESLDTGKPLFSYAGGPDCIHCRKMEHTTFKDKTVIELLNREFVSVKFPGRPRLIPTMYLKRVKDKEASRKLEGYRDAETLLKELKREL